VLREETRRNKFINAIFKEVGNQNFLTGVEAKTLQWYGYVNTMDRTMILRRALDLKFEGTRPMGQSRKKWLARY
jgi:hypothetical protein